VSTETQETRYCSVYKLDLYTQDEHEIGAMILGKDFGLEFAHPMAMVRYLDDRSLAAKWGSWWTESRLTHTMIPRLLQLNARNHVALNESLKALS
jgi:hypothetical protein